MKSINTLFLLIMFVLGAAAQADDTGIKKEKRNMGSFDRIKASKGINVTLIEGNEESVEVNIKNGDLSDVVTELKSRQLVLKMKTKIYKDVAVQVYVNYKNIREIEAGSGASVDAHNTIYADKLTLHAGTDSNIVLEVDANAIQASGSASRTELSGECKVQEVQMGTGAKYLSYGLSSKEAVAKATLGSNVEISVDEKLTGTAGSGGVISFRGSPDKIEKSENTGGKVNQAD